MAAAAQRPEGPGVSNRGGSSRESGVTGIADRADARSGHAAAVHESGINRKADGAGDWGQSAALLHEERVMRTPFDTAGVTRGPDGIKRYDGLPSSLVHMLRDTVEGHPDREALAETGGGPRLTYRELWDRAARVAGGLRAAGLQRGDRVALRLGNGVDWVLGFFGAMLAGATVVPVNTRLTEDEVAYVVTDSGASYVIAPGDPLPDGPPLAIDDAGPDDPAAIFYTSGIRRTGIQLIARKARIQPRRHQVPIAQ